jgi:hypothetical protein
MTDPGISMTEVDFHFGPSVPQEVFDFIGSNRIGLTVQQKRSVLSLLAKLYHLGVDDGRKLLSEEDRQHLLYMETLDRLAQRIAKLEKNA